jgi:hypothetical protein
MHLIGTRSGDLPAWSIVPQPTTLPRASNESLNTNKNKPKHKPLLQRSKTPKAIYSLQQGDPCPHRPERVSKSKFINHFPKRISPPTSPTTCKWKSNLQLLLPSLPWRMSYFPNNRREGKSHGTWDWWDYVTYRSNGTDGPGGGGEIPGRPTFLKPYESKHGSKVKYLISI